MAAETSLSGGARSRSEAMGKGSPDWKKKLNRTDMRTLLDAVTLKVTESVLCKPLKHLVYLKCKMEDSQGEGRYESGLCACSGGWNKLALDV